MTRPLPPHVPARTPSEPLVLEPGKVIAKKYLLDRPAGFGGMAELWVAINQATGAEVCVKILVHDDAGADAESIERFRREAQAIARLSHRAIVRVFDLLELDSSGNAARGTAPHAYAIVMELLKGETLGDLLAKRTKLPLDEALDLFLPVVSALAHAHRASVIHRDIKPDNIFLAVDPDGQVIPKVLDFGVSKLANADGITVDGAIVGTPSFMSPEQAKGARRIDARSDVFSAAVLFHMMLTGANPFEDGSFASVVDAIVQREVPPIDGLSPSIWAVLQKALEKDPALRFADATEMGIDLRKAAGRKHATESERAVHPPPALSSETSLVPVGSSLPPPGDSSASDLSARRNPKRAIVAGVMGVAAGLLVAALLASAPWPKKTKAASRAPEATPTPSSAPAVTSHEERAPSAAPVVDPIPRPEEPPPIELAAPASPAETARPVVATPRPAAPAKHGALPVGSRKPGEEPKKARDPGF